MNGLEALKRIRQETAPKTYCKDFDKEECCNTIEKELKAFDLVRSSVIATLNIPIIEVLGKKCVEVSLAIPIDEFGFFKKELEK